MKISVITVTYNNDDGLSKTLQSLSVLKSKPYEVIIIDAESIDNTTSVVEKYLSKMNIIYINEKDNGIYDAMNKGRKIASGDYIHYLNAGDCVSGDIYANVTGSCLIKVGLFNENDSFLGFSSLTHSNTGYCHQGVIFPKEHLDYELKYKLCADYDLLQKTFPEGLASLPLITDGYIKYDMSGVSANKTLLRDKELFAIIWKENKRILPKFVIYVLFKAMIPKGCRRFLRKLKYSISFLSLNGTK